MSSLHRWMTGFGDDGKQPEPFEDYKSRRAEHNARLKQLQGGTYLFKNDSMPGHGVMNRKKRREIGIYYAKDNEKVGDE